jgi:hypothetical protein
MTSRWVGLVVFLLLAVAWTSLSTTGCDPCASCSTTTKHHRPTPTPTPAPGACSGQGLIGLDPVNNVGYVPLRRLDVNENAQVAVVNLAVGAANPVIKTLSLMGASTAEALAYNPANKTILAEALLSAGGVGIFEIDATTQTVLNEVNATGLDEGRGGVLQDTMHNRAFVAGVTTLGILDTSMSPPVWNAASVVSTGEVCSDSLALNISTGLIFYTCDGNSDIFDSTMSPLVPVTFQGAGAFGTSDGVAFDPTTNIMILGREFEDANTVFNMATLNAAAMPATADNITVPGLGVGGSQGEGQGMAAINCTTHQGVLADEGGQNVRLIQLPTAGVPGALDNNGQPGTMTTADAASAFTIATTLLPPGPGGDVLITMQGDPNSASVDPKFNFYYAVGNGDGTQYLIRLDLSAPVLGGSPTGGPSGTTHWNPTVDYILLP